jgi:hypothetical protein
MTGATSPRWRDLAAWLGKSSGNIPSSLVGYLPPLFVLRRGQEGWTACAQLEIGGSSCPVQYIEETTLIYFSTGSKRVRYHIEFRVVGLCMERRVPDAERPATLNPYLNKVQPAQSSNISRSALSHIGLADPPAPNIERSTRYMTCNTRTVRET